MKHIKLLQIILYAFVAVHKKTQIITLNHCIFKLPTNILRGNDNLANRADTFISDCKSIMEENFE